MDNNPFANEDGLHFELVESGEPSPVHITHRLLVNGQDISRWIDRDNGVTITPQPHDATCVTVRFFASSVRTTTTD